jgi:GTP cyclohydrolase I
VESKVNYAALQQVCRDLLTALGDDLDRPGIAETPRRFAAMWREFIEYDPGTTDTVFECVSTDQMVVISGMRVWSMCEHHLLPFWCDVSIGYIADDSILGLSKFGRIAHQAAHKLQLQERLCSEIAEAVVAAAKTTNVAVLARGEHLCMTMRGIKTPARMTSSIMRGLFRDDPRARAEFLALVDGASR